MKKRYPILAVVGVLCAVLMHFPASWAFKFARPYLPASTDALSVGGTIWNGQIKGIEGLPLIRFTVSPKAVFGKSDLVKIDARGNDISVQGNAGIKQINALIIKGSARFLGQVDGRLSNLSGRFDVEAKALAFGGDCSDTTGTVSTDILAQNFALWNWRGPELSGPIRCEDGDLLATLSGHIPGQSVEATVKVMPSGQYRIRAVINTNERRAGLFLPLYGFERKGERYTLVEAGKWR